LGNLTCFWPVQPATHSSSLPPLLDAPHGSARAARHRPNPPARRGTCWFFQRNPRRDRGFRRAVPATKHADLIHPAVFSTPGLDAPGRPIRNRQTIRAHLRGATKRRRRQPDYWIRQAQYDPGHINGPHLILPADWDADLPTIWRNSYQTASRTALQAPGRTHEGTPTVMMKKTCASSSPTSDGFASMRNKPLALSQHRDFKQSFSAVVPPKRALRGSRREPT